jgi:hypothetical protein
MIGKRKGFVLLLAAVLGILPGTSTSFGQLPSALASVTVGDFNRDGIPDLAVTRGSLIRQGPVSILLGVGDGTFQLIQNLQAGLGSSAVALGDFNSDDIQDLAVANAVSDTVTIFTGRRDGTFAPTFSIFTGGGPGSIVVTDVNGDKIQDLVVARSRQPDVLVVLGQPLGGFKAGPTLHTVGLPSALALADFNGDEIPDLAVTLLFGAPPSRNMMVFLGTGGGFGQFSFSMTGQGPQSLTAGDFNGDERQDLAVANANSNDVSILLGNGDGTFTPARNYSVGQQPRSVAVGDFNGDGIPDLAVANEESNTVSILIGHGDGTFSQPIESFAVDRGPQSVAVGDFNEDDVPDLATANAGSGTVSILLGHGDGTFAAALDIGLVEAPRLANQP